MIEDDDETLPHIHRTTQEAETLAKVDRPTRPVSDPELLGDLSQTDRTKPSARDDADGPSLGTVLAGKYEIVRLIGAGGMGRVYKGQHLSLGVPIAIKTMHQHYAGLAEYVRRFRREAHAISLLSHPNVVRVLDFGESAGILFLV